jgi:type IV secretory pathway VirB10-like protein
MKKQQIVVMIVGALALGVLVWSLSTRQAPAPATEKPVAMNTPDASAPAPKPAASTGIAPPKIAAPAPPPVAVTAAPKAAPVSVPKSTMIEYQPQADLGDCVAQTIKLLDERDIVSLVKTLMPPDVIQQRIASGQVSSVEDIAAQYTQLPNINQLVGGLQSALESVKDKTPDMNDDGTQATYKLDPSVITANGPGADGNLRFVKVNGYWYLR